MLKLLLDENFNNHMLRGVLRHIPHLDYKRVQDIPEIAGADDKQLLEWAAQNGYVLLTHDFQTIPGFAYERIHAGLPMAGVFAVKRTASIRQVADDLVFVIEVSRDDEWQNLIQFLPLT